MANSKISALTSATTPLAGTETVPIVQSGATVKTTVADITGAGTYPGYFTTLTSTVTTILGDATTDTVTVNGYMGVGGAAVSNIGSKVSSSALTGVSQIGFQSVPVGTSAATTQVQGVGSQPGTAAAVFTCAATYAFRANNAVLGAGSTITNQYGLYVDDQTNGTNNYGITSLVSSGTNKWNIYASGTANNYFAGNVGIGISAPSAKLDLSDATNPVYLQQTRGSVVQLAGPTGTAVTSPGQIGTTSNSPFRIITNNTERIRIDTTGNAQFQTGAVMPYAPAPAGISAAATLTNANIQAQIISATGTTYTITMPLGTTLETLATWVGTGVAYDFFVINTASGIITMAVNTGVTSLGSLTIAIGASAHFRIRRTAANTFVLYRLV
jgi:hypothetical protein